MRKIDVINYCISAGSPSLGSEKAPEKIAKSMGLIPKYNIVERIERKPDPKNRLHHKELVEDAYTAAYNAVKDAIDSSQFPLLLGGDHSVAAGSLRAIGEHYGADSYSVIYLDAHTDMNTEDTTISGYIHGMPLAIAMGLCGKQGVSVLGKNIYVIGARSVDEEEVTIAKSQNVNLISVDELRHKGISNILNEINTPLVYISFDVDSIDSSEFKATGYNLDYGLKVSEVKEILYHLANKKQIIGFECVEYNPTIDNEEKDLHIVKEILSELLINLKLLF